MTDRDALAASTYAAIVLGSLENCGTEIVADLNREIDQYHLGLVKSEESEPGDVRLNDLPAENGLYDVLLIPTLE